MIILEKKAAGLSAEALGRFVLRARRAVGLPGNLNVLVTGNAKMRSLNLRFRKKNKATDVLSFPSAPRNHTGKQASTGEIAISADIARRNAAAFCHSVTVEVKILALHGILHLAGFDHERDNGLMARNEATLRRKLGLPSSLTERGQPRRPEPGNSYGRSRLTKARRTA